MKRLTRLWVVAGLCCGALLILVGPGVLREIRIRRLLGFTRTHEGMPPSFDAVKLAARNRRGRRLHQIWMSRAERDISSEVIFFLRDPDSRLRESAARVLGRIEHPAGEAPLAAMLEWVRRIRTDEEYNRSAIVNPIVLGAALARIRTRGLNPAVRVQALAGSAGLTVSDLPQLFAVMNDPDPTRRPFSPAGRRLMRELIDLLYDMRKAGHDIQPFVAGLVLSPAQRVKLQGASLPLDAEVTLALDYLATVDVNRGDISEIANPYLAGLGPRAAVLLLERLSQMEANLAPYRSEGCGLLFRAAAVMDGERALPVLRRFEQHADPVVHYYAGQSRRSIEEDIAWPYAP